MIQTDVQVFSGNRKTFFAIFSSLMAIYITIKGVTTFSITTLSTMAEYCYSE